MAKKTKKQKLVKELCEALAAVLLFDEDGKPPKEEKPKKGDKGKGKGGKGKKDDEDDDDDDEDDDDEDDDDDDDQRESGRATAKDAAPDEKGTLHKNRKALLRYIKREGLKLETKGKTVAELRKAIAKAEAKPKGSKRALRVLQDTLAETIEEHDGEVAEMIEDLGCGGDCYKCPHPEKKTVRAQVKACIAAVYEELELELPRKAAKALAKA